MSVPRRAATALQRISRSSQISLPCPPGRDARRARYGSRASFRFVSTVSGAPCFHRAPRRRDGVWCSRPAGIFRRIVRPPGVDLLDRRMRPLHPKGAASVHLRSRKACRLSDERYRPKVAVLVSAALVAEFAIEDVGLPAREAGSTLSEGSSFGDPII